MKKLELNELDMKSMSHSIFHKIEDLPVFKNAKVIMAYWSMFDEVDTHDFILKWYKQKIILLPVIDRFKLKVRIFAGIHSLKQEHRLGIHEPIGDDYPLNEVIDLIIVPGLAFDLKNNRLGRGMAYYDKFLSEVSAYKIGVCFDMQMVERVPTDIHDIRMDMVITN